MIDNGIPEYIRSDNGPEFIAKELRNWLSGIGVKTAYIEPGSPWENGFCESFNGTFRDNLLDGEIFYSLKEAQIIVGEWVKHYNTHSFRHTIKNTEIYKHFATWVYCLIDLANTNFH
jgi:transposase InsO family protein